MESHIAQPITTASVTAARPAKRFYECLTGVYSCQRALSAFPPALAAMALLVVSPITHAAEAGTASAACSTSDIHSATDARTKQVLKALVHPTSVENRTNLLEQYLASPAESPDSAQQVAISRARLVLAAERIKQQNYIGARQSLAQIDLSSTVAVDAALLLAESWRLQGDSIKSQAWLMRVAQRYSSDPRALEGLLLSARDQANNGKIREAWTLYSVINDKVLKNVEQIGAMRVQNSDLVNQLLATRLDESRDVSSQVVKNILQQKTTGALSNMRQIFEAKQQLACLEKEGASIKDDAWDESIQSAHVISFKTMLETEANINARQLQALKQKLAQSRSEQRPQIEEELSYLQENMASLAHRLNELNRQEMALPADSLTKKKQLEQSIALTESKVEQNKVQIRLELDSALVALQDHYRELAAETQLARAELMQLLASNN